MVTSSIDRADGSGHVNRIIREMELRCRTLERMADVAERVRRYQDEVLEFVKLINIGFFSFVSLLNEELDARGLGSATLHMRPDQPDLVDDLHPMENWAARRFSLVRADLAIRLCYVVHGVEKHLESLDAVVLFWPQGGVIDWRDGGRERFRVHREDAFDEARFGSLDLWDLISGIGLRRTGREEIGGGVVVDDPEAIVLRRICVDERWPGWVE